MKCVQCGSEIPKQSKFCLSCGAPIVSSEEVKEAVPEVRKRKLGFLAVLSGLAVVVALALLISRLAGGSKVLDSQPLPEPRQTPVVNAPNMSGRNQPALLDSDRVQDKKDQAPAEVIAYLEHVKKVEDYRKNMRMDLTPAFEMLKKAYNVQYDPDDEAREKDVKAISGGYNDYTAKWQQIVTYFNSVKAPSGCEKLASAYGEALGKYSETMMNIELALSKQDASALYSMYGSAQADVDTSLAQADDALSDTCKSFGITKNFSISTDKGVGSLLTPSR